MDQMNLLPNNIQRLESSRDPLQAAQGAWMVHSHNSPIPPWPSQPLPLSSLYFTHQPVFPRPPAGSVLPAHSGQHGSLPHPDRNMRGFQSPEHLHGLPLASPYWNASLQPIPGMSNTASLNSSEANTSTSTGGFGNLNTNARDLVLRPPAAADWASRGATSATHPVSPSHLTYPDGSPNTSGHQIGAPTAIPSYPVSPISPRRPGQTSSPSSYRSHRPQPSTAGPGYRDNSGLLTPASDRRRQAYSRARRTLGTRQSGSDPSRPQDDSATQQMLGDSPTSRSNRRGPHGLSAVQVEDMMMRQMQMFRGTAQSKMVASKAALQALESVEVSALPETERTCVICYNDYGIASPEGINEAPLRIPQCKHIFGDHCIKKWLDDSDSCPYCRSKLQSEPKHSFGSARTFMQMMRLRGLPLPTGVSEEMIARVVSRPIGESELQELFMRSARSAERRSPPDDASGQDQRRTRQRRSSSGVTGDSHFADLRATQAFTRSDGPGSELQSQPAGSYSSSIFEQNPWMELPTPPAFIPSEPFSSQLPPRSSLVGVGHNSVASGRRGTVAESSASRATRAHRIDLQGTVIANGSSIPPPSMPNPLQRLPNQRRPSMSMPGVGTTSRTSSATQPNTVPMATSSAPGAELTPLRPSRNRPW